LGQVIDKLPRATDPNLLVGTDTLDDAAVYRLSDGLALVQTVDFFTPVVDDPYDFGRIAAANAFSDVYAMGGRPLTALNIVGFPSSALPLEYLSRILAGGAEVARLAGATIVGGHTIDDPELKYGLAVTGLVRPDQVMTNAGAQPGDALVLSKPVGTGIIATAIKRGSAPVQAVVAATTSMTTLNRYGSEVARECGARAVTDVTGFGLLGHLAEMCRASHVAADVWFERVPLIEGAEGLARQNVFPGGGTRNLEFVSPWTVFEAGLEPWRRLLLADPQTSGGLLFAVPPENAKKAVDALGEGRAPSAAVVGRIREAREGEEPLLRVRWRATAVATRMSS
jgi:selenide,water dikinase